ncbi:MAG: 3-deoxy-manno-octulosonate cytidylyltransferase [Bacteriovorax sp.]|jgi:3-deoxy-manno-octulosonate cytidylyltransferase (CMP-KDO synthetase)
MTNARPFIVGLIPARLGATRFPGKPMAPICGIPMIGHVYKRAILSRKLDMVAVATCDREIFDYIVSIEGKAVLTADTHERASDRCAEAMLKLEKELGHKIDIVVMIQGDEPLVNPSMIDQSLVPILSGEAELVNLYAIIDDEEDYNDPNEIKVVMDKDHNALYFSRRPIPFTNKFSQNELSFKQVCIIPFKRENLIKFNSMKQTALEKHESIDMLRVLENGEKVKMVFSEFKTISVDNQDDLKAVEEIMPDDELFKNYK